MKIKQDLAMRISVVVAAVGTALSAMGVISASNANHAMTDKVDGLSEKAKHGQIDDMNKDISKIKSLQKNDMLDGIEESLVGQIVAGAGIGTFIGSGLARDKRKDIQKSKS